MITTNVIHLVGTARLHGDAWVATVQRRTASCTSSAVNAVLAAAHKALPHLVEVAGENPKDWRVRDPIQISSGPVEEVERAVVFQVDLNRVKEGA
jgi:hypothetical protein